MPPVPRACGVRGGAHLADGVDHLPVAALHLKRAPRSLYQRCSMLLLPFMLALLAAQHDGILRMLRWPRPKDSIESQPCTSFMTLAGDVNRKSTASAAAQLAAAGVLDISRGGSRIWATGAHLNHREPPAHVYQDHPWPCTVMHRGHVGRLLSCLGHCSAAPHAAC